MNAYIMWILENYIKEKKEKLKEGNERNGQVKIAFLFS